MGGKKKPTHILAAGGLLEREADGVVRIAVLRRRRYRDRDGSAGDRVLPKGKVKRRERLAEAALREVREETGCRGRVLGPCHFSEYEADGVPKVTVFFRMACEATGEDVDASEVLEVTWVEPAEAREILTYESEREVVRAAYG